MEANNTHFTKNKKMKEREKKRRGWWRMRVFVHREMGIFVVALIKIWLSRTF